MGSVAAGLEGPGAAVSATVCTLRHT